MKIKAFLNNGKYYINVNDLQKFLKQDKYKHLLISNKDNFSFNIAKKLSLFVAQENKKIECSYYITYLEGDVYVSYSVLRLFYNVIFIKDPLIIDLIDTPWQTDFIDLKTLKFVDHDF